MLKSVFIVLSLLCSSNIFANEEEKVPLLNKTPQGIAMQKGLLPEPSHSAHTDSLQKCSNQDYCRPCCVCIPGFFRGGALPGLGAAAALICLWCVH